LGAGFEQEDVCADITGSQKEVNDLFVVTKKGTYTSRENKKYMMIGLKDATGSIDGRVWEAVDELEGLFEKGDMSPFSQRSRTIRTNCNCISPTSGSSIADGRG
jgi:sulfite reductase beta subunit-like hemoprotein